MSESTQQPKYMDLNQFAKAFMDFYRREYGYIAPGEKHNYMGTEVFAKFTYPNNYADLVQVIHEKVKAQEDFRRVMSGGRDSKHPWHDAEQNEAFDISKHQWHDDLTRMSDVERQCFEQLIMAINDNSPEAKNFLKIATVVSSIAQPEPLRLKALISAIQKGGITDPKLSYEYLRTIDDIAVKERGKLMYNPNLKEEYTSILRVTRYELANHPFATVNDKYRYVKVAPKEEKMALLTDAAHMVEESIKKQQDELITDSDAIKQIVKNDANDVINMAYEIAHMYGSDDPEYKQLMGLIDIYKREFNVDNILNFGAGDYIGHFRDELAKELVATKEDAKRLQTENAHLQQDLSWAQGQLATEKEKAEQRIGGLEKNLANEQKKVELYKAQAGFAAGHATNIESEVAEIGRLMDNIDQTVKTQGGLPIRRLHELQDLINNLSAKFKKSREKMDNDKQAFRQSSDAKMEWFKQQGGRFDV